MDSNLVFENTYSVYVTENDNEWSCLFEDLRDAVRYARRISRKMSRYETRVFATLVSVHRGFEFSSPILYKLLVHHGKILD